MTAARLGDGQAAMDALVLEADKNRYLANGHNCLSQDLPITSPVGHPIRTTIDSTRIE